jgi:hypothetical protein
LANRSGSNLVFEVHHWVTAEELCRIWSNPNTRQGLLERLANAGYGKSTLSTLQNLCIIAHELLEKVKQNVTFDWSLRENARARIRILVKRILRRYGYPPDLERTASELVLEQTEVLCNEWV